MTSLETFYGVEPSYPKVWRPASLWRPAHPKVRRPASLWRPADPKVWRPNETSLDVSGDAWKREYFSGINTLSSQRYMTSLETFYGGQRTLRYGAQRHYGGQRALRYGAQRHYGGQRTLR